MKLQLIKAYKEEELYWSQKARCRWLQEGDKNTAYFHASVMATRRRNKIIVLQRNNDEWCKTEQEVMEEICNYYQQLFTTANTEQEQEIIDNVLIAQEFMHFLKNKRKGGVGFMALKLDMSKVYDRVEWKFVGKMMMQGLSHMINRDMNHGNVTGIKEAKQVKDILQNYSKVSGQLVNFDKSAMYFSRNTPKHVREEVCQKLGDMREAGSGRYLGLPMAIAR
nr:uncharacterized protein LOC113693518 [Coffea arabica]